VQISAASEDNQPVSSASATTTTANEVPSTTQIINLVFASQPTATTNNNNGSQPSRSACEAMRYARLFTLFPTPGLQWRFISIENENINVFAPQRYTTNINYENGLRVFNNTFDFSKISGLSIQNGYVLLSNVVAILNNLLIVTS
jgi:hypothetical protein